MGIWKRPRGLRGHPFPGRRAVGAGHARPGGWRGHPSMVRPVGRGLDPSAGGYPGDGCWRKVSRGVGDAAPLRLAREWAAAGACPSSGPAGPPSPKGEGKGCCWRQREVAAGWGHPALRMGIWKRCGGLRGHPFPGRRAVGAGHARPGGWREHPSMVRSVGRGLDPSAGDCPGDGRWRKVSRGVGDAAPYGLPGNRQLPRLTPPTSPPTYSRCCRRQNRWGRSAHRPHARFRRWIRSRGASGHRRSGPEGTGVCCRRNFSAAG